MSEKLEKKQTDHCEGCPKYPPSPSGCTCRVPPDMSYQEWKEKQENEDA